MSHVYVDTNELATITASLPEGDDRQWCRRLSRRGSFSIVSEKRLQRCRDVAATHSNDTNNAPLETNDDADISGQSESDVDAGIDLRQDPPTA